MCLLTLKHKKKTHFEMDQQQQASASKILSINFNQSHTYFTTGTDRGFAMYRVNPLEKMCERDLGGGIDIAVQLYETNFIGLVGNGKNPKFPTCKFVLWDDYKAPAGEQVVEEIMKERILAVRINNEVVALVTAKRAKIYNLKDMNMIKKIKTGDNPGGVCALSSCKGSVFLCPGLEIGTVNIVNYANKNNIVERIVKCHEHPVKSIALNTTFDDERAQPNSDTIFATASDHGTLIKLFDIEKQTKIKEFRRGGDATEIYALNFSRDSKCLAVTSSKGTVHVYSLSKDYENVSSRASILGGVASYFNSEWSAFSIDFASAAAYSNSTLATTATTNTKPGGKDFQQPPSGPIKHIACVVPLGDDPLMKKQQGNNSVTATDTYRLIIMSEDGTYAVHDLQFKDTKSIAKFSGMLQDLKSIALQKQ
jgi:WD40 repeat protein